MQKKPARSPHAPSAKKTKLERLRDLKVVEADNKFADLDDAPEITDEMLDRAEWAVGGRVLKRGRPLSNQPKRPVTIRLDADIVDAYRKTGAGWQTRINADLRRLRKLGKKMAS